MDVEQPTLAQRLGRAPDARIVIVSCDDIGLLPEVTHGAVDALTWGVATSGSLMAPCPSAAAAATEVAGLDIGVHLTLNCEWEGVRWQPLTLGGSLCRHDGTMFRSVPGLLENAAESDVAAELRAQIEQVLAWGVDVTHLTSHMYAVQDHSRFQGLYLEIAAEYRLPVRLSGSATHPSVARQRAAIAGVFTPDHLIPLTHVGSRDALIAALADIPPGVTEFHAHPARETPQLRKAFTDWEGRVDDHRLYCTDEFFRAALAGIELIGYRELRDLMRSPG